MEEQESTGRSELADLNQLLDYGFLTEECVVNTEKGDYRFELQSITPLEEADASKAVNARAEKDDTASVNVHTAIEYLARTVTKVNGVPLEELPYTKGETAIQKKRYVISKLSEKLMFSLWDAYLKLKERSTGDSSPEDEEEAVKK